MRRAPRLIGAAILAGALVAAGVHRGGSAAASASPASAACVPVHHSKWIVKKKRVKRGGKTKVVKRRKKVRWTTCAPQAPPPPPPGCPTPSSVLGVTADDADSQPRFILSRACVTAGEVTVELNNVGEDPHHVFMRPLGLAGTEPVHRLPGQAPYEVPPLSQQSADFELTPGDWYLWCDLLLHEEQGMSAHLSVR